MVFLKQLNEVLHGREPGVISAAEESTAWPGVSRPTYVGGLGFGFKWNMGWMHDTLGYFQQEPIHRRYHHHELTFSLMYAFSENFILPLSHDEVVHGKGSLLGKMTGDHWQKLANLRALYAYMWAHPGKKLLFMGQEFAQEAEWSHERSLDWHLLERPRARGRPGAGPRPQPRLQGHAGAVGGRLRARGLLLDRAQRRRRATSSCSPARRRAARTCSSAPCNLSPVPRDGLPGRAAALGPLGRGAEHRLGFYGGSGVGQPRRRRAPRRSRGTASPTRPRSRCRRSASCGSCPRADAQTPGGRHNPKNGLTRASLGNRFARGSGGRPGPLRRNPMKGKRWLGVCVTSVMLVGSSCVAVPVAARTARPAPSPSASARPPRRPAPGRSTAPRQRRHRRQRGP